MRWILGSAKKDVGFFVLPGLAALVFVTAFPQIASQSFLYMLIAVGFIDSGHVYTTVWRTYFNREERNSSSLYLIVPLVIFAVFSIWTALGASGLWSFVVYATVFHNIRQFYGFNRWYQGLNGRYTFASDLFLYSLCVIPFVAYHFKPGAIGGYYSEHDLFLFPNVTVFAVLVLLHTLCVLGWLAFEFRRSRVFGFEWNRLSAVAVPALVYGICFFNGHDVASILTPLVISHGIGYFGVMSDSLTKTQKRRFPSFARALAIIVGTAVVCGGLDVYFEGRSLSLGGSPAFSPLVVAAVSGLYLIPLFTHFIFDARIWRRRHREAPSFLIS